ALLADASALVRARELPRGELLALATRMLSDPDFLVLVEATGMLSWIDPHKLATEQLPSYRRMIDKLLGAQAKRLGWSEKAGEANDDHELRGMFVPMVARWSDDPSWRTEATRLA